VQTVICYNTPVFRALFCVFTKSNDPKRAGGTDPLSFEEDMTMGARKVVKQMFFQNPTFEVVSLEYPHKMCLQMGAQGVGGRYFLGPPRCRSCFGKHMFAPLIFARRKRNVCLYFDSSMCSETWKTRLKQVVCAGFTAYTSKTNFVSLAFWGSLFATFRRPPWERRLKTQLPHRVAGLAPATEK
jgi:hypothetical protein